MRYKYVREHTFTIAGYGSAQAAQVDCVRFNDPAALTARADLFPDPHAYGVMLEVMSVEKKPAAPEAQSTRGLFNTHSLAVKIRLRHNSKDSVARWISEAESNLSRIVPRTPEDRSVRGGAKGRRSTTQS